ncbi:TetR/AcrR family transcriptional regulator [Brevibacillus humidisoli]|uniref:TetR/AcrR family transcriptional regulator n=1 Tax=Brevibacillus humidisoli TaxID=2895522 RepID=UPI001E543660|nr:TetR/AcrR family transcriptional regulator [Brevibacillus humidisoli]UFJ39031.1 TetR/AcrR family transcriptional regulator [Brevibacillus humidisoli]
MKKKVNRKAKQGLETRQKLIEAALRVFSRKGFSASTTKDIAREAGVTDGLIYHYFQSKEQLLWVVLEQQTLNHKLREMVDQYSQFALLLEHTLQQIFRSLLQMLHQQQAFIVMFFGESQRNPVIQERLSEIIQQGVQHLYRLLAPKVAVEETYLRTAIRNVLASVMMFFLTHDRFAGDETSREQYIRDTVQQFMKGLE